MAVTDISAETAVAEREVGRPRAWAQAIRTFARQRPLGACGAVIVLFMLGVALAAPLIAPRDPLAVSYEAQFTPPGAEYWFGTDDHGRDILSRIIHGSRTALLVGFGASFLGATLGLIIGVASAYFGGRTDLVIQRIVDTLISFPLIILALAVVALLPRTAHTFWGVFNVVVAITVPMVPRCARVVRSSALAIREIPYVEAARALASSHLRIIFRHMLPNVMAPYLIMLTAFLGQAILLEASLSFLGLGVQEPIPAWGLMLQGGAEEYAESAPWVPIFPGLAISLAVFAFNVFGDSLRDALDPRLRGT